MRKLIIFLFLAALFLGFLYFSNNISDFYSKIKPGIIQTKEDAALLIQEFQEKLSTPPPLIFDVRQPQSFLTKEGVLKFTNEQRKAYGLPLLKENSLLNLSAKIKAEDMLVLQYFEHVAPSGKAVGDLARVSGYEFIAVGENLALGDFENDEKLVQGWMDSPGHRENILNSQYQEIGIAVLKGEYRGRETWLAVQHFGRPLSACPEPPSAILQKIKKNQNRIEELSFSLSVLQQELTNMPRRGDSEYNQKVKEYNKIVSEYNFLIEETKFLVKQYNNQVKLFNECAKTS